MIKAIALGRVSTEKQEDNTSLATQQRDMTDYARIAGIEIVDTIMEAETGYDHDRRPGLTRALALLHAGEANALLVWKLDRFTRNVQQGLALFNTFQKRGWHLISVNDRIDTSTPAGMAFFQLSLVFAELHRNEIAYRTAAALQFKKSRGEYTGGQAPYGYRRSGDHWEPVPFEQEIISYIRKRDALGYSAARIAAELNSAELKTKERKQWTYKQVKRVLRGPVGHAASIINDLGELA